MKSTILNYKGEVVYECAGGVSYDHGYWVRIYSLDNLTTGKKDDYEFAEYYGQRYTLVEETEKDDNICPCCDRPLPEKDQRKIGGKATYITITEMIEGNDNNNWMVCFR